MRRSLAAPALVVAVIGLTTLLLAVGGSREWLLCCGASMPYPAVLHDHLLSSL